MNLITSLAAAGIMTLTAFAPVNSHATTQAPSAGTTAAPDVASVKASYDLMAAMQAEKLVRTVAGSSRYPNEQQRAAVLAKVEKLPAEEVYKRLSAPVAKLVSAETAAEMARFYQTSYGQKLVKQMYNSGPSFGEPAAPQATPAEKADLKKPAYVKASKELDAQRTAIRHEVFVLVTRL